MKDSVWHLYPPVNAVYTSLALFCDLLLELTTGQPAWIVECILETRGVQ